MNPPDYRITFWDGVEDTAPDLLQAMEIVRMRYPDAAIGHAGDLQDGGTRTLCWETEKSKGDDNGEKAIAVIRMRGGPKSATWRLQ